MKFGSRMDVFVPPECTITVTKGQRVRGGETVIARWPVGRLRGRRHAIRPGARRPCEFVRGSVRGTRRRALATLPSLFTLGQHVLRLLRDPGRRSAASTGWPPS